MSIEFTVVSIALMAMITATAMIISRLRGLYGAAMVAALFSLLTASLFVLMDAVDVAFTEAAVGVGVSTVLVLTVLALTHSRETVTPRNRRLPAVAAVVAAGATLIWASQDLPDFGALDSPVQNHPLTEVYYYYCVHLKLAPQPAFVLDISDVWEKKIESIRCYESQFATGKPTASPTFYDRLRDEAAYWGKSIGTAYGEPITTREPLGLGRLDGLV